MSTLSPFPALLSGMPTCLKTPYLWLPGQCCHWEVEDQKAGDREEDSGNSHRELCSPWHLCQRACPHRGSSSHP